MKIFFWTLSLDHHNLHTWNAIQSKLSQKITYVLTEPENRVRKLQGWKAVDLSMLDTITMNGNGWLSQSLDIIRQNPKAIHVFMGFWTDRRLFPLMVYAVNRGIKTAVISEQYSTSAVGYTEEEKYFLARSKVILRPFLYRFAALMLKFVSYKKKQACIFSVSPQAQEQYIKAGFKKNTIFPFGYFVPKTKISPIEYKRTTCLRLVFVGSLLKRKGLDIAVEALNRINEDGIKITMDVYGSGDPTAFIPKDSETITYKGLIPVENAQAVIAKYDALILPSRHDGWGVVINESLLQGIPVIVSDKVGAKCLIEPYVTGIIFKNENVVDLTIQLNRLLQEPALYDKIFENVKSLYKYILPEVAAQYFLDTLAYYFYNLGPCPQALWCNKND